ncbi:MAG: hypothetical protein ISR69_14315 [Gammaproteobacteria bacterium]|nr:hypothetical protein [archaeon]MBL7005189.1 hypothetical protein [Gammaproteobacteria bacterium]
MELKVDSEFLGSATALTGAFLMSTGYPVAFFVFLVSNLFFIKMSLDKKMKPFLMMQGAFMTTSFIGIYNNFLR